jgi:hypothetical protein
MALSEGSPIDLQVSSLRNMSVGLKKSPSNGCENLLTSDEQQAKVLVFCICFFSLGHENANVLLEEKLLKDS